MSSAESKKGIAYLFTTRFRPFGSHQFGSHQFKSFSIAVCNTISASYLLHKKFLCILLMSFSFQNILRRQKSYTWLFAASLLIDLIKIMMYMYFKQVHHWLMIIIILIAVCYKNVHTNLRVLKVPAKYYHHCGFSKFTWCTACHIH